MNTNNGYLESCVHLQNFVENTLLYVLQNEIHNRCQAQRQVLKYIYHAKCMLINTGAQH